MKSCFGFVSLVALSTLACTSRNSNDTSASGSSGGKGTTSAGGSTMATGGASASGGAATAGAGAGGALTSGGSTSSGGSDASGGALSSGGTSSAGSASGGSGGGFVAGDGTKPPVPPGPGGVAKPAGAAENLQVLHWAGFTGAVTYTFDDAQPSQVEHMADLLATEVRLTFYLNTSNAVTWQAGWDQAWKDALAAGSELGNHTINHCYENGSSCNGTVDGGFDVDKQLDDVDTYITDTAGQAAVWTMAYPWGDTAWATPAAERFIIGRSIATGMISPNDSTDPFDLPTIGAAGGEAASKFNGDIDTAHSGGKWVTFLFHSILPTGQNWYAGTDLTAITGSIDHAKSLGDMWIDTMANIGAYWLGEKALLAVTPVTAGPDTTWTWTLPAHFPSGKILRVTVDGGTLKQADTALEWDEHGYYEISLDEGSLTLSP